MSWTDPVSLLLALIGNSPELNTKVALISVVEYLLDAGEDAEEEERTAQIDASDLFEIIYQCLAFLHHHVGDTEDTDEGDHVRDMLQAQKEAPSPAEIERLVTEFRDTLNGKEEEK
jgi:hypothetical protein